MERKYDLRSKETLDTITVLMDRGITKMSLILRHSDRHYCKDPMMEPFMGLTDSGKTFALDLGIGLPAVLPPRLFASHFGRCIETAYLVDKGFTMANDTELAHTVTSHTLAPFYIKDIGKALELMMAKGGTAFIRSWFDREIDDTVMEDPERTANVLTDFMLDRLDELDKTDGPAASVCISHDWNIFPIKEFKLGLPHEGAGDVGYLDGVAFFKENGATWATTFQTDPVKL
ncbi:MAG: histidine phosphatase family protein [Desulfobacterales bacterium]|nr:histidine phosphatase family protein [Desulfobacterales bacterium]